MTGDARYRAIVNTYFSLSGSVLISYVMSMFVDKKRRLDMVMASNNFIICLGRLGQRLFANFVCLTKYWS